MPPPSRLVAHPSAGDKCSVQPVVSRPHLTSTSTSGLSSTVIPTLHDSGDIPLRLAPFLPGHSDSKRQCRRRVPETGVPSPAAASYTRGVGVLVSVRTRVSLDTGAAGGMSAISRAENAMTEVYPRSCCALVSLSLPSTHPNSRLPPSEMHYWQFPGREAHALAPSADSGEEKRGTPRQRGIAARR